MSRECCEACDGSGKINNTTCKYCQGVGWFEDEPSPTLQDDRPSRGLDPYPPGFGRRRK